MINSVLPDYEFVAVVAVTAVATNIIIGILLAGVLE